MIDAGRPLGKTSLFATDLCSFATLIHCIFKLFLASTDGLLALAHSLLISLTVSNLSQFRQESW